MQGKVVARNITKTGKLHYSISVVLDPKKPTETKTVDAIMELAQVEMAQKIGAAIPVVGMAVECEFNVNPSTGLVSDQWVTFSL